MNKLLLMYSNGPPSLAHIERLNGLREDVSVVVADSDHHAADTDIILGHRRLRARN